MESLAGGPQARLSQHARAASTDVVLVVTLYALEASALLIAIGLHGHGQAAGLLGLSSRGSRLFVGASVSAALASVLLAWRARRYFPGRARTFWMTIGMNLLTVAFACVSAELILRATVTRKPQGEFLGSRLLLPRRWSDVSAWNRELLGRNP